MQNGKIPQEIKAEESVLVSIILDPEHRGKAFEMLHAEDFYSTANRIVFEKCKAIQGNSSEIQTADIYAALSKDDKKYVKAEFLYNLTDTIPLAVNIESYIQKLKDAARYRRAIELANAIAKNAYISRRKSLSSHANANNRKHPKPKTWTSRIKL
jgi:replicative DNA helicase